MSNTQILSIKIWNSIYHLHYFTGPDIWLCSLPEQWHIFF